MTPVSETIIRSSELHRLVLACAACSAEVSIDVEQEAQHRAIIEAKYELGCPICGQAFDSAIQDSVRKFVHWKTALVNAKREVAFRVTL